MPFKPSGYTSVAPYLIVDDARGVLAFLVAAFAAERLRLHERSDGGIQHAEARIDDTVLMVADALEGWPALEGNVHIYVPDVDATFDAAVKAGGKVIQAPERKADPDRRGGIAFGGIKWWIATQQNA